MALVYNEDGIETKVKPLINSSQKALQSAKDAVLAIDIPSDFSYSTPIKRFTEKYTNY